MKYDLFFKLAKEAGIEQAEIRVSQSRDFSMSLFHGEMDNYELNDGWSFFARGIINGKMGTASVSTWSKENAKFLVNEILNNAKVIEDEDPAFIFKGSEKYKRISTFNKELENVSIDKKIADLHELEQLIAKGDKRITEVGEVAYAEHKGVTTLMNSHGLKLVRKINYFYMLGQAVAKQDEQIKSGFDMVFENDYSKLDVKDLAKRIVEETTSQLGGEACKSGPYKVVLDRDVMAALLPAYISSASSEEVQKHTSLFIGKVNQKIASKKVTIEDKPLAKTFFASYFDDEGVATYNKFIIKNGVLQGYLYNLTTAAKEGVQSTGNAAGGVKMSVEPAFLVMKKGKSSKEELFQHVGDGVYVTSVSGLHAGLDARTGNFSLQASGFLIKDGKKDHPLDVITVSGNLLKLFEQIELVGSDNKISQNAVDCPSVIVKQLVVGGK